VIEIEELGFDATVIIKWIFKRWDGETMTLSSWLSIGTCRGSYECGNETSGSIKFEEFLDYPRNCKLLKKDSAACSWSWVMK
jgi:hypothetical protein